MDKAIFIVQIGAAAVEDYLSTGVLPSITIAQAALESGWGRSAPGNNLFGIKGSGQTQTTQECINGIWVTIQDGFAVFSSWLDAITGHSRFLLDNGRYAAAGFFIACNNLDYRAAAKSLQRAGYATDPGYADKLIGIIESNQLYQFDKEAYSKMGKLEQAIADLQTQNAAQADRIKALESKASMPVPDWAKESVQAAVAAGIVKPENADGSSYDFYRILTVMKRKGVI